MFYDINSHTSEKREFSAFLEDIINSQIFLLNLNLKCKFSSVPMKESKHFYFLYFIILIS